MLAQFACERLRSSSRFFFIGVDAALALQIEQHQRDLADTVPVWAAPGLFAGFPPRRAPVPPPLFCAYAARRWPRRGAELATSLSLHSRL